MSDLDALCAMLERASVPFRRLPFQRGTDRPGFPKQPPGATTSLLILDVTKDAAGSWVVQPYDGGYAGFYTEAVFDGEGNLQAVWAWE